MKTILFYSPFNQRSRDTESLMITFYKQGHKVISLSQSTGNFIHEYLNAQGIETFSYTLKKGSSIFYFIKHIIFFITFCHRHNVGIVYSHLESANFVAVIAQYFIAAKVYIVRHHVNEAALQGFDRSILYRMTYRLAKKIIVVSNRAAHYMALTEKINPAKIIKINLAYDFSLYPQPSPIQIQQIKNNVKGSLILLTACRFNIFKRAELSILTLKRLRDFGIDAKLILLGRGEEEMNLKKLAAEKHLTDCIFMPGYVNNITDYLASADIVLHPSVLESSCVLVKEAAITKIPVIVCKDVGDFDEYIRHEENAFMVNADTFVDEAVAVLLKYYQDKEKLRQIASNLERKVRELFSIEKIVAHYKTLNA